LLQTDASRDLVGAILTQKNNKGEE
jgi:hypothetical protein